MMGRKLSSGLYSTVLMMMVGCTVSPMLRKVRSEGTCGLGRWTLHRNRVES